MPYLCYWYGSKDDPNSAFSFHKTKDLLDFEQEYSLAEQKLVQIKKKIEKGEEPKECEKLLARAMKEMIEDREIEEDQDDDKDNDEVEEKDEDGKNKEVDEEENVEEDRDDKDEENLDEEKEAKGFPKKKSAQKRPREEEETDCED
jgi:hypothetical protein